MPSPPFQASILGECAEVRVLAIGIMDQRLKGHEITCMSLFSIVETGLGCHAQTQCYSILTNLYYGLLVYRTTSKIYYSVLSTNSLLSRKYVNMH